jgi:hypothetical protein
MVGSIKGNLNKSQEDARMDRQSEMHRSKGRGGEREGGGGGRGPD